MLPRRRSTTINREALTKFNTTLLQDFPADGATREIASRFAHPLVKASVLAFFLLDAQLTLLGGPKSEA